MLKHNIEILDCTLRDASYQVQFQFTEEDCMVLAAGLEKAGIGLIEVGHGLGLNASGSKLGVAAATDIEYITAASSVLKETKLGVFAIPNIASINDVINISDKINFIRIGVDVDKSGELEAYIKTAKQQGLEVSANLMKSYMVPVYEISKLTEKIAKWGADIISVVDSAGCMMPNEVSNYVKAVSDSSEVRIGFHGHNNMQLAIANSLAAIDAGATIVDTTLRGMGRSSGNAQTEVIALLLSKYKNSKKLDVIQLFNLADKIIKPICRGKGVDAIEALLGFSKVHSGMQEEILHNAKLLNCDPRILLYEMAKHTPNLAGEYDWNNIIKSTKAESVIKKSTIKFPQNNMPVSMPGKQSYRIDKIAKDFADSIFSIACKLEVPSVVTLSWPQIVTKGSQAYFSAARTDADFIIAHIEVRNIEQAKMIAPFLDGKVDIILADRDSFIDVVSVYSELKNSLNSSKLISYSDFESQLSAAEELIIQLLEEAKQKEVAYFGMDRFSGLLVWRLLSQGYSILLNQEDEDVDLWLDMFSSAKRLFQDNTWGNISLITKNNISNVVVGAAQNKVSITEEIIEKLPANCIIVDAGVGTLSPEAIKVCIRNRIALHRVDVNDGLNGKILTALSTENTLKNKFGYKKINGVQAVSGGAIGELGAVVVDAVNNPTRIIGVANGKSGLLLGIEESQYKEEINIVYNEIMQSILM